MGVPTVYAKMIETAKERKNDEIVEKVKTKYAILQFHSRMSDLFSLKQKWNFFKYHFQHPDTVSGLCGG